MTVAQTVLSMLQALGAIAVLLITSLALYEASLSACYLSPSLDKQPCDYAYGLAAVSITASFIVSLIQCFTCDLCGLGFLLDGLLTGAGTAWWVLGVIYLEDKVTPANNLNVAEENWRNAVFYLAITIAALFFMSFVLSVLTLFDCLCCAQKDQDVYVPPRYAEA